ncbi:hypothetical protein N7466_000814 [Penicillium verhagenii]|uniref:uncharacterized protein n=1 Tax=Penicillium verhagenii TaxID=1562060 RepID=UPI002545B2B1|nr:uncharacterized protein N7466_000814 [Penicillium verhagenii]KAJ5947799.1 hypothetical protein N7466_000814 [Penicillium verhagenii]
MESTREERLQMRQRGAGTRQIKAVDFGFSFGAPASDSAASAPIPLFPEPNESSQTQPASAPAAKATTPPPLKVSSQPVSQTIGQPQRTPGSARNRLPQRLSTYDIPIDDRPEGQRSNKRRRITSPEPTETETPSKTSVRVNNPNPSQNGGSVVTEAAVSHNADVSMADAPQQETPMAPALPEDPANNTAEPDNGAEITNPDSTVQAVSEEQTQSITQSPSLVSTTDTSKEKRPRKSRSPPPNDSGREIHHTVDPIDSSGKKQRTRRSPPQIEKSPVEERAEQQTVEPSKPTSLPSQGVRQLKTRIPRAKPTSTDTSNTDQPEKTAVAQSGPSNQESENVAVSVTENADNNLIQAQKSSETTKKTRGRKGRPGNSDRAPVPETETETQPQLDVSQTKASSNGKRSRNKPWLSTKELEEKSQTESGTESEPSKSRRGKPSLSAKKNDMKRQAELETEVEPEAGPSTSRRGRSATNKSAADPEPTDPEVETMSEPQVEPEQELVESEQPRSRRGRVGKKAKLVTEPEPPTPEQQLDIESEPRVDPEHEDEPEQSESRSKSRRGRPGKKAKLASEPEPPTSEQQLEIESEPRVDPEHEDEPEQSESRSKSRRGRLGKKTKLAAEPESINPEEQVRTETEPRPEPEQEVESATSNARRKRPKKGRMEADSESTHREEAGTETVQERRKPKEPRGETVPVTVHRLFNPSALGAMYASSGSGDEDEDSADELSARQKTKLPNRGGVNHADVLSQICRETLEKTLAALNNGIENETNTQRRAEWTRKRKSVQVFGSELDGRLLDLSEMLDSNFVLGVQLKKTKREMMDMRAHLYKVRRERESIALQMDAVRAKHMEEEKAKTSRTTINNSLHSLDLALDRQHRAPPATDPSPADLEFMLRTVAEDVSCRAPGAQGGLLDQIRAFNAQLEATARRLERQ